MAQDARASSAADGELIASLPMYDLPELQEAHAALWEAIRSRLEARGVPAPPRLARPHDLAELWRSPRLLLAQTCGYPLVTQLRGRVRVLATPCYAAEGCEGPFHRAAIVVRRRSPIPRLEDLLASRLALNAPESNTGMNLLRATLAPLARRKAIFSSVVLTGAHVASCAAVAEHRADVAAIDAVTWALLQRRARSAVHDLRVLAWTVRSPGLPLVTSHLRSGAQYAAIAGALDEVGRSDDLRDVRRELLIDGFQRLPEASYEAVSYFEQLAVSHGYNQLQ